MTRRPLPRSQSGVALLLVVSMITILALVLVEFSSSARLHLDAGVNARDEVRALTVADTALVMTRACLDDKAWGAMAMIQRKVDLERMCGLLLGVFLKGRIDLPIGGLSVELNQIEGLGIGKGEIEELKMTPEESFIGLAGLHCDQRGTAAVTMCKNRSTAMKQLRALFCDPRIAHVFEMEQADGKRYTREEVVGNLIDWIDADDNRIKIDPLTWNFMEGAGEGEDAYLRDQTPPYRSKDAPFDSIQELRMVPGIDDDLYAFIKDKVSVHSAGKLNVNKATADVIASLLYAASPDFQALEAGACGKENDTVDNVREMFLRYASIIVEVRKVRASNPTRMMGKPFKNVGRFMRAVKDPIAALKVELGANIFTQNMAENQTDDFWLTRFGFPPDGYAYRAIMQTVAAGQQGIQQSVRTDNNLYRLEVKARVGNMTRSLFAVLKKDGKLVRTLYYREE